jgi:hypothetical protein
LPPLSLREKPELSFEDLMTRLELSLSKKDFEKVKVLRLFYDITNIRLLLKEEPIDPHGNLSEKELDEALLVRAVLPDYVHFFLERFEKVSDKIRNFPGLLALFFNEEIPKQKGFLKEYLKFERESRLVLLALRAKQLGRDVVRELQYEEPTDPFIAHILAQKDAGSYDPPMEYADLKELIAACYTDPWAEYRAFAEYRFNKIEEMVEPRPPFSIDQVLGYTAQLMIVEAMRELDAEKGNMILGTFKTG